MCEDVSGYGSSDISSTFRCIHMYIFPHIFIHNMLGDVTVTCLYLCLLAFSSVQFGDVCLESSWCFVFLFIVASHTRDNDKNSYCSNGLVQPTTRLLQDYYT